MNDVTLHHGDCLDVMSDIPAGSVDLIAADLPYGLNGCRWDSVIPFGPLWAHYRRVLKPRGAVVLTASQPFTSALVASNPDWFRYCLVWDKVVGTNFQHANHQPLKCHEDIVVFSPAPAIMTRDDRSMTYNPQKVERKPENRRPYPKRRGKLMRIRGDTSVPGARWDRETCFPRSIFTSHMGRGECNAVHRLHNSQKPVALMEYLILTYSNLGDVVLDNAMGSGTTGVSCLRTGRRFIGIEKDADIFATAVRRLDGPPMPLFDTVPAVVPDPTPLFAGIEEP